MNQGKLEVVKQEMWRVNINIFGVSELKWTGMGEFNPDDHYNDECEQESLRRNAVCKLINENTQNLSPAALVLTNRGIPLNEI